MIGETISHYKILEKLGEGGMGVIYKAQDLKLDRHVALKFLPSHLTQNEEAKKRFIHEAQAASALDHPNICTVYEIDEMPNGQMFIAMAYCEGESLKECLDRGPLDVDKALDIVSQVSTGLSRAHKRDIVHRDIKPANILLTPDGVVKIVDFGLAKLGGRTKITRTGSTVGTIAYMSPEQARGEEVDQRSDIWSLGVILYEMLSGKRPFEGYHEQAVAYSILNEEPKPVGQHRPDVPKELEAVISKALQKHPEDRYANTGEFLADLKKLGRGHEVSIALPSKRRTRTLKWVVPLAALLLSAIVGIQLLNRRGALSGGDRLTLAVVDFEIVGGRDVDYLAGGLADGISVKLSKLANVRLVSSDDVRRWRREDLSAREVAFKLGARYAIGGTLLKSGEQIRVTPQLIETSSGDVIWSELFDRTFGDVFEFLDEISLKITNVLKIKLDSVDRVAMRENPTKSTEAYDHYLKGRYYYYRESFKDNERAVTEFQRALQIDPDYPLAMAGLADAYLQRSQEGYDYDEYWLDEAERLIKRALDLDPGLAEAHKSRASVLIAYENYTGALEAADKARRLRPEWDEPYVLLGDIYRERGERGKALDMYDSALALRPSVAAWCGVGLIRARRGEVDSAEVAFKTAIELNPYHERPHIELGWMYKRRYELNRAEAEFRRAIELRPDRNPAYWGLMDVLEAKGQEQDAITILRGYVKNYPYNWGPYDALYNYLAWWIGDYKGAIEVIEEAVKQNSGRAWPHLLLAQTYAFKMPVTDEPEKAVQAVKRALELRPQSPKVLAWAGYVYSYLDSLDTALMYFERSLALNSNNAETLNTMARRLIKAGRFEEALDKAMKAVRQNPGTISCYFTLAEALAHLGRFEEFFDILSKALDEYGDDPSFWFLLANEQITRGEFSEAVQSYLRVVDMRRDPPSFKWLGIAQWLSGDIEAAMASFRKAGADTLGSVQWRIALWKYLGETDSIKTLLSDLKKGGKELWTATSYYVSMRQFDRALAVYEEALASGKEKWSNDILVEIAKCYRRKGDLQRAERTWIDAQNTLPSGYQQASEYEFALISAVRGNLADAENHARKASAISSWYSIYHAPQALHAKILYALNRPEDALHSLSIIKGDVFANLFREYYVKGQLAMILGAPGARSFLRQSLLSATQLVGRYWEAEYLGITRSYCAKAAARLGDFDRARLEIEYALRLEPERMKVAYNAACTYALMGNNNSALRWLKTAVDRGCQDLWWARVDPDLDSIRALPAFQEIMNDWEGYIETLIQ